MPRHNGAGLKATLVVQSRIPGTPLVRVDVGELPKEISVSLPAAGTYRISVAEQRTSSFGVAYRGDYRLELEASAATARSLVREAWTE